MRAPFPWFGGKSRVAHLVWAAFGDVPNFVEPFAGSLAVLLARPTPGRIETANDADTYLSNFWRCVGWPDPVEREGRTVMVAEEVARWADWPVNEADLHARHRWLVEQTEFRERMRTEPEYFDAKIAGWWVWGLCQWIGSGWCWEPRKDRHGGKITNPAEEWAGRGNGTRAGGIHAFGGKVGNPLDAQRRPNLTGDGVHRRSRGIGEPRPDLTASRGILSRDSQINNNKRPHLWRGGMGVHSSRVAGQIPHLAGDSGAAGRGIHASAREESIYETMTALQARLRRVRVCCGDWSRVLGPSATEKIGVTGVFLDPPYSAEAGRDPSIYSTEDLDVAHDVRDWAIANGDNPKLRIALCGYEGEHQMPDSWTCVPWKAVGGYAASAGNTENAHRERIWFSPHCLPLEGEAQRSLFAEVAP